MPVVLSNRGMTGGAPRKIGKNEKPWCTSNNAFHAAFFFAWPRVLTNRPPVLWWLSLEEVWDAVTRYGWDELKMVQL